MYMFLGILKRANLFCANSFNSLGLQFFLFLSTTAKEISSPNLGCLTEKDIAFETLECFIKTSSTSLGLIFSPPLLIISFILPDM